jgi:Calx-beta domain
VTHAVTVDFVVQDNTARAGSDFTVPAIRTVTIPAGSQTAEIRVPLLNDNVHERTESFNVLLTGPKNATTVAGSGTTAVTITDDEAAPRLTVEDITVSEGAQFVDVTVRADVAADRQISFDWVTANGTAVSGLGGDYTAVTALPVSTGSIAAGSLTTTLRVTLNNDTTFEGTENFFARITNARFSNAADTQPTIFDDEGTITITDNEAAPTLRIEEIPASTGAEGNSGDSKVLKFRVKPSVRTNEPIRFTWSTVAGGTAIAGTDYTPVAPIEVMIPVPADPLADMFLDIEVPLIGDADVEADETLFAAVSNASLGAGNTPLQITKNLATGTIQNDEALLSIGDLTIPENTTDPLARAFTVTLSGDAVYPVTVFFNTSDGTAISIGAKDFDSQSAMLTFNAGETTKTITIVLNNDSVFEGDETFRVLLTGATNAFIADNEAFGTITDDEVLPGIRVADARIAEGDAGEKELKFRVSLTNLAGANFVGVTATKDVTFKWAAKAGGSNPAEAGVDFTIVAATPATILRGQQFVDIAVKVKGDTLNEADETLLIELTDVTFDGVAFDPAQIADSDTEAVGTIQNDDLSVRIAGGAVTEGNAGAVNRNFDISIPQTVGYDVTVTVEVADGTATLGQDYLFSGLTPVSGDKPNQFSVTIPAGQTLVTLAIAVLGDELDEVNETFTARLLPETAVNAAVSTTAGSATGTINDDDAAPTLSIADATILEGENGEQDVVFTVTLSAASGQTVSVLASTAFGTATAADLTAFSQTLIFLPARPDTENPGSTLPAETSKTFTVKIKGDALDENDETFTVALTNVAGATFAKATATGTITDNDAQPTLSVASLALDEGNDAGTTAYNFTISLSAPSGLPVTFDATTVAASATSSGVFPDYVQKSQAFTFEPGQTSKTFTVLVNKDSLFEENETFSVALSNVVNAGSGVLTATGTIRNDDAEPTLSIGDASVVEGNPLTTGGVAGTKEIEFTVQLSAPSAVDVTFDWAAVDGTAEAGSDYSAVTTSPITIPAGQTSAKIRFSVAGDATDEADEAFLVNVSNVQAGARALTITDAQGEGKILNDDLSISVDDLTIAEGDGGETDATFRVKLVTLDANGNQVLTPSTHPVTVHFRTQDGTAVSTGAAADFTAIGDGLVTFDPGETEKFVTVKVRGDLNYDLANAFTLVLSQPAGARILDGEATGTIIDNDVRPVLSISDVTRLENADAPGSAATTAFSFHITLSAASDETVEVSATTFDGTAIAGQDFTAIAGQRITFAPGETDRIVTVSVLNDAAFEVEERFAIRMHDPLRATFGPKVEGLGTIQPDDDATPRLKVTGGTVTEGGNGERLLNFTVARTGATGTPIKFKAEAFLDSGDDAEAGVDFALLAPDEITMEPSETTKTVSVRVFGDAIIEGDETFSLKIIDVVNAELAAAADGTAKGTILDDDARARFAATTASVAEGNSGQTDLVFLVALSGPAAKATTITYTIAAGTAVAAGSGVVGADFQSPAVLSIVIPAGASTGEIRIPVLGDNAAENDETLTLTLTSVTNGALDAADVAATGTILNDDAALRIGDVRVIEGQSGTRDMVFVVTLEDAAAFPVTVHFTTQPTTSNAASIGSDFGPQGQTAISGDLTFLAGETTKEIVIAIIGDTVFEGDEIVRIVLSDARANGVPIDALLDSEGIGTISDDDALLSIGDVIVQEGNTGTSTAVFTVTLLPAGVTKPVTVKVSTVDGTAISTGSSPDFVAKTETLTFETGQTTKTFRVVIIGDLVPEALEEMFTVALSDATGAAIQDGEGIGTIRTNAVGGATIDDPLPAISIADAAIVEGNSGATNLEFIVSLTQPSGADVTFTLASSHGTTDAADFTALPPTTFTIPAGEKTLKVSIPILGDLTDEADETFTLTLTDARTTLVGVSRTLAISDGTAVGTILNDESTVSIGNASVLEVNSGNATLLMPVSIATAVGHQVVVTFTVTGGTATAVNDFTVPTILTATIPAGQTTVNVPVTVKGDAVFENDETLTVTLTGATGALLGTATATGTILNDDQAPTVTIVDSNGATAAGEVSVNEGAAAVFTVRLAAAAERDITLRYVTANGSAEGDDYAQSTLEKTLLIPAGQTEGRITIATIQDTRDELDETFQIRLLADPSSGVASDLTGTATIRADQNDLSTLSIGDAQVAEGNSGTKKLTFTVSRTGASALLGATVNFTTADGLATKDDPGAAIRGDYVANAGVLTFLPGERTKTIEVLILGDTTSEIDETFFVSLTDPTGAKLGDSQALGRILNDEVTYELVRVGSELVLEDGAPQSFAVFNVIRSGAAGSLNLPGTVTFTTEAPTTGVAATAGADYTTTSGTVSFTGGATTATQQIRVPIISDSLLEANETFVVRLTAGVNGILSANDRATVTIDDSADQGTLPKVIIETPTTLTTEGAAGTTKNMAFIVKLVGANGTALAAAGDIEVTYSTANLSATDGSDFTGTAEMKLIIPAGQTQGTILIPIIGDGVDEVDEEFAVNLGSAKLTVPGIEKTLTVDPARNSAIGKIANDDLTVTIAQVDGPEGNADGVRTFTLKLSQESNHPVTLKYRTVDGSAKGGEDFIGVATPTLVTIPANVAEHTFTIATIGDLYAEPNESFTVAFSDITNAELGTVSLLVNIFNDDAAPTLTIGDASVVEGDSGTLNMVFTVTLAGATREPVTVDFATSEGTAKSSGPVPDFVAEQGTLLPFQPSATGGATQEIRIPIVGDSWRELTESFTVALSNARLGTSTTGVTITDATATGTITDNGDATLGVFLRDARGIEGSVLEFEVETTAPTDAALSFTASTRPGTANSNDFVAFDGQSFTIASGGSSVTVPVETRGDTAFELTEFMFLDVNGLPAGAEAVTGSGTSVSARGFLLTDDIERVSEREFNYVDVDGDIVNVRFSKGSLAIPLSGALESNDLRFVTGGTVGGRFLELINLSDDGFEFEGVNITVRAEPQVLANGEVLGDGRGDVGLIFAAVPENNLFQFVNGVSLGRVQIDGDLGRVFAGSTQRPAGISVLEVGSFGVREQDPNSPASGNSIVLGPIGRMIVHGDVAGSLSVIGDSFTTPLPSGAVGRIGSLVIEGALKGGSAQDSGRISYTGGIGKAVIGSIEGGSGQNSGSLRPFDNRFVTRIGSLTVTGGIEGGSGQDSGYVEANRIGALVLGKQARRSGDVEVQGNLAGGSGQRSGLVVVERSLGSVFIHGDIVGGESSDTGKISVTQKVGNMVITGSIIGGAGSGSGTLSVGQFSTVTIQGSLTGGTGANSGSLSSVGFSDGGLRNDGDISKVTIGKAGNGQGNISGGSGQGSGGVFTNGKVGQVVVHGSITGGTANFSGAIAIAGTLARTTVFGSLLGGTVSQGAPATLIGSGFISAENITNLFIKGDITAGIDNGAGLVGSGSVRAGERLGTLRVDGDVTGNATAAALISARDGIGSVKVGGDAAFAEILAGYTTTNSGTQPRGVLANAGASIGSVAIAGTMTSSSLVAGVFAGVDGLFGTADDDEESNGSSTPSGQGLVARIAKVLIGSAGVPTIDVPGSSFGIVSEQVVSVIVGGAQVRLLAGPDNDREVIVGSEATKLKVHET